MSNPPVIKYSPYERAVNELNKLPRNQDKIFSDALEDLRKQRKCRYRHFKNCCKQNKDN